jgi:hypothetical protein
MTAPSDVRGPAPSGTLAENFRWIRTIFSRTVRHTEHCMIFEARVAETTYLSRGAREPLERTKRVTSHSESQLQQRPLLAGFCCKSPLRYAANRDSVLLRESRCGSAWGPDGDRHAKLLIHLAVEGSTLNAYSHSSRTLRHFRKVPNSDIAPSLEFS